MEVVLSVILSVLLFLFLVNRAKHLMLVQELQVGAGLHALKRETQLGKASALCVCVCVCMSGKVKDEQPHWGSAMRRQVTSY